MLCQQPGESSRRGVSSRRAPARVPLLSLFPDRTGDRGDPPPAGGADGAIIVPIAIYTAFNAGGAGAHGWGAAMSTDTAFALGALALLTPRAATRLRVFLLTLAVVDDLAALLVIATVYTGHVSLPDLGVAIGLFA